MVHRLTDSDLRSVREPAELENLPKDERVRWVKLWAAVRDLRDDATPTKAVPPPQAVK
jgi:hypothetical protein